VLRSCKNKSPPTQIRIAERKPVTCDCHDEPKGEINAREASETIQDGEHPVSDAAKSLGDHRRRQDPGGHANERLLAWWKSAEMPIPEGVFFMCVDIVVSDAIHQKHSSDIDKRH
jgi:hypothetical protein